MVFAEKLVDGLLNSEQVVKAWSVSPASLLKSVYLPFHRIEQERIVVKR
jgi:hypothetical protein|tara:strand:+ start:199 stop:345 length:147 start_codon:yes stop_codon:yes gene_type:complete